MVESISKSIPNVCWNTSRYETVEENPGWHAHFSIDEIIQLLDQQKPYTYVISQTAPTIFLLSFVRENDQGIIHIQFNKMKNGLWHYINGADNVEPSLRKIIRKMMHLAHDAPEPIPLAR